MAGVGRRSVAIARVTVRPTLVRPGNAAVPEALAVPGQRRPGGPCGGALTAGVPRRPGRCASLVLRLGPSFGRLFPQYLQDFRVDGRSGRIVMRAGRGRVHAGRRHIRLALPRGLGDHTLEEGREHAGLPPVPEPVTTVCHDFEPARLPPLGTRPDSRTHLELGPRILRIRTELPDRQERSNELLIGIRLLRTRHLHSSTGPRTRAGPRPDGCGVSPLVTCRSCVTCAFLAVSRPCHP